LRFESLLWSILLLFLVAGWDGGGSEQPLQDAERLAAADGGSIFPPP
jgi:hypothetical protein